MTPVWNVAPHPHATPAETPGNWRKHDIHPFPEGMTPPQFLAVDHRMADWVKDVNALREDSDVAFPERLAKVHNDFEQIHLYLDGNGRAGRLLLNLMLVRLGYPPAIVFKTERTKYLDAMRKADKGDYGPLGELIARAVTDNDLPIRGSGSRRPGSSRAIGKPGRREGGYHGYSSPRGRGARSTTGAEV